MTSDENLIWLTTVKSFDKSSQWNAITQRLFRKINPKERNYLSTCSPMIVINGVLLFIPDSLSEKSKNKIFSLLNDTTITDIKIIDTQENWTFCSPFAGAILIMVEDKLTSRQLARLKLE